MSSNPVAEVKSGLEGVVAAQTRLSSVDGEAGELIIGGYQLEEFANRATFEETVHLLWYGTFPNRSQLAGVKQRLAANRSLPEATISLLKAAAGRRVPAMDALRMGTDSLSLAMADAAGEHDAAFGLVGRIPTIIAHFSRMAAGQPVIEPDASLSHAANYLYMLSGEEPDAEHVRALDTYLNTVVDHGLNASTFTARVIASTASDIVSALVGAVAALKGPLHGGAPEPVLEMIQEIGSVERAEPYLRAKLEQGDRLMGFGHRVYKVRDPRADVLAPSAARLLEQGAADPALFALFHAVEEIALKLLAEYKPGRRLQTNVEFYTALLLHTVGLEPEYFTTTFAMSRSTGWIAHYFEQQATGRLIRPQSVYVGPRNQSWVPLERR